MAEKITCCDKSYYELDPGELPLSCPLPNMSHWNAHPRVFLAIEDRGEARCPYCGTLYILKGGPLKKVAGH
ncbi:zinc-finger domain-containing protein [Acidithiobacillus sp.]